MSIQKLIDIYAHWLKEEIVFKKMGEYYEITTPFYNNANDNNPCTNPRPTKSLGVREPVKARLSEI